MKQPVGVEQAPLVFMIKGHDQECQGESPGECSVEKQQGGFMKPSPQQAAVGLSFCLCFGLIRKFQGKALIVPALSGFYS